MQSFEKILNNLVSKNNLKEINERLLSNVCLYTNEFETIDACQNFLNGIPQEGLISIISSYLLHVRSMIAEYNSWDKSKGNYFDTWIIFEACKIFLILDMSLEKYVKPLMRDLRVSLVDGIKESFNSITHLGFVILMVYLLLLITLGLFFWVPFLNYFQSNYERSKRLLAAIPLELIIKIKRIQNYIIGKVMQINN